MTERVYEGLAGVVVTETRISEVDGERGSLVIAGHPVEALAERGSVEDVAALLWGADEAETQRALGEARARAFAELSSIDRALSLEGAMDSLRACVAHIVVDERAPFLERAAQLTGAIAVFAAAHMRKGALIAPDPRASHAADYLRMARGSAPSEGEARAMAAYLATIADHGMNASTFAARVVASTGSDDTSSVVAAIGALKGPLHGGAPGPVLDMLDAVGDAGRARSFVAAELDAKRRIMGMGHRIYRVRDPRAEVLERALVAIGAERTTERLALARAVEREAERALRERHPDRPLRANVEFYTAVLLEALAIPRTAFTATFAAGRALGWLAHIREQREHGKLIRPESRYIGPRA